MKKHLTLTTTFAAALTMLAGCSSKNEWDDQSVATRDTAICTNAVGDVVDDDLCRDSSARGYGFTNHYYRRGARLPYYGDSIRDPRYATGSVMPEAGVVYDRPPPGVRMTRSAALSRGGLGSTGRGFGGGLS